MEDSSGQDPGKVNPAATAPPASHTIPSRMTLAGEPIHPMMIHFPMALLIAGLGTDLAFIFTEDPFWARASLWLIGIGTLGGWGAGVVGFIDLAIVAGIRRLITGWCHGIIAVMMLSLASFNWLTRVANASDIFPWGLALSALSVLMVIAAGVLGGRLVYEHGVGVELEE